MYIINLSASPIWKQLNSTSILSEYFHTESITVSRNPEKGFTAHHLLYINFTQAFPILYGIYKR